MSDLVKRFQEEVANPSLDLHEEDDCGTWYIVEADMMDNFLKELEKSMSQKEKDNV